MATKIRWSIEAQKLKRSSRHRDDELVCVVAVGGSGISLALIDKVVAAFPMATKAVPELRMVVVTGPRNDPAEFSERPGLEPRGYLRGQWSPFEFRVPNAASRRVC